MRLAPLTLAVVSLACSGPRDPTLRPTADLYEPLAQAIAIWNPLIEQCGRSLSTTADDPDFRVYYGTGYDADGDVHTTGFGGGSMILDPHASDDPDGLVKVITHELGHVLGADDSPDPDALMYEWPNGVLVPTDADVRAVCR
jgi:hypothetical protein